MKISLSRQMQTAFGGHIVTAMLRRGQCRLRLATWNALKIMLPARFAHLFRPMHRVHPAHVAYFRAQQCTAAPVIVALNDLLKTVHTHTRRHADTQTSIELHENVQIHWKGVRASVQPSVYLCVCVGLFVQGLARRSTRLSFNWCCGNALFSLQSSSSMTMLCLCCQRQLHCCTTVKSILGF